MENEEIIQARNEYFNKLKQKNEINHSRIDELDVDNIGIILNYQQIDLMNLALKGNKISYKKYQDSLFDLEDFNTEVGKGKRDLLILETLKDDLDLPEKVRITLTKIYEETKKNKNITDEIIIETLQHLISKLSTDLQKIIYNKINKLCVVSYEGVKDMSMEEALKLLAYIKNDYTCITINVSYQSFVNPNDTYNRVNLEQCLSFAYENDLQVRIASLISYDSFPDYLKNKSQEILKQKLITYVDYLTKYIKNYNITHKRTDRKPIIRSVNVFNELITSEAPYEWRGKSKNKDISGWQFYLSLEELCDIISIARKNLPDVNFVYNDCNLENKSKRLVVIELLKAINVYEKNKKVKLIDTLGLQMHVDLDILKDDIVSMFDDLKILNMPLAITEFDLCAPVDMIKNNSGNEIEILRDRFISDLCNIVTYFIVSKQVTFDSITIDSVNDKQNHKLTIINNERLNKNLPLIKTIYGGIYDNNMNRKEINTILKGIKSKEKSNNKGVAETLYVGVIIIVLIIVIVTTYYLFVKFM